MCLHFSIRLLLFLSWCVCRFAHAFHRTELFTLLLCRSFGKHKQATRSTARRCSVFITVIQSVDRRQRYDDVVMQPSMLP